VPLRLAVRLGLKAREQLSLRLPGVSAGARPHPAARLGVVGRTARQVGRWGRIDKEKAE
jgi:hypothetical protein